MPPLTPENFWLSYKAEIKNTGSWSTYQNETPWTEIAKSAAETVCKGFGFQSCREKIQRVDVCGYTGSDNDRQIHVAFETENRPNEWVLELLKLMDVESDLRVVVGYQSNPHRRCEEVFDKLQPRFTGGKWLFIFGPHSNNRNDCWAAYTVDQSGNLVRLPDDLPLRGIEMKD